MEKQMAQVKEKKVTKEKVYEIETLLSFRATIPVLGVDEEDARNNLYNIYKEEFSSLTWLFYETLQSEGWVDNGHMDDRLVFEGNERWHDYLLEKRKEREERKSRLKVSKPVGEVA